MDPLPRPRARDESVPHAPVRTPDLSLEEQRVSVGFVFVNIWFDPHFNVLSTQTYNPKRKRMCKQNSPRNLQVLCILS